LHPTDSSYWTNKGLVLLLQREYAEAVACFDVSLRLDPLNKTAKTYRALVKENQGDNKFV
ncbi:tetratricopeptide repeat protein, partial [Nitrosopumilus sp.]|nr:tetratricopeptide repeat protein [Nitrosopumilus sp.]